MNIPLPTIPGETAAAYKERLRQWRDEHEWHGRAQREADVRRCQCGCHFELREALAYIGEVPHHVFKDPRKVVDFYERVTAMVRS